MRLPSILRATVRRLFRGRAERDLDRELQSTIALLAEEKIAGGASPEDAWRAARVEFGGVFGVKEAVRDTWPGRGLEILARDVRYGVRLLWRSPGSTLVILAVLALGIGANTAVVSVIHTVLLHPLAVPEPDRVVSVWETRPADQTLKNAVGGHEFPEWKRRSRSFEHLAAVTFADSSFNLTGAGEPLSLFGARVTSDFFAVFGVLPALGRGFTAEEDVPGHGSVVVLGHDLWQTRFGGDVGVLGRAIALNDQSYTVVGVMPAGFRYPVLAAREGGPQLWTPIAEPFHLYRGRHFLFALGRLKPEVGLGQAQAEMDVLGPQVEKDFPDASKGHRIRVVPMLEELVGDVRPALIALMAAVAFVLLIACANVASLLLARSAARRKEMAVRTALGAGRARLVRQLLTESLLLAGLGGALGILLARTAIRVLPRLSPVAIPRLDELRLDPLVLGVTAAVSILTGILFGLAPAFEATRLDPVAWLKDAARTTVGLERQRLRRGLVVAEVALTVLLLAGAGLLLRTFDQLRRVPLGFQPEQLLVFDLQLPKDAYPEPWQSTQFYDRLFEKIRAVPGVEAVAGALDVPLGIGRSTMPLALEGQPAPTPGDEPQSGYHVVSADYFRAMSIPLRRGRDFTAADARRALPLVRWWPGQPVPPHFLEPQALPVAIVNETMARRFWPGEDPIGKRLRLLWSPWITVAGVVGDVRYAGLAARPQPEFYLLDLQEPQAQMSVTVRARGGVEGLGPALRAAVWSLDPGLPVSNLRPMEAVVSDALGTSRFVSFLVGLFACAALLLTALGLYGLVAYAVSQRTHEIGIRLALGGKPGQVMREVAREGLRLTTLGLTLGIAGALALTGLLARLLYQVEPRDPVTFLGVILLLGATALVACYLPARRALRVDPMECLRTE
jgi:putative ABC transport system permease protein